MRRDDGIEQCERVVYLHNHFVCSDDSACAAAGFGWRCSSACGARWRLMFSASRQLLRLWRTFVMCLSVSLSLSLALSLSCAVWILVTAAECTWFEDTRRCGCDVCFVFVYITSKVVCLYVSLCCVRCNKNANRSVSGERRKNSSCVLGASVHVGVRLRHSRHCNGRFGIYCQIYMCIFVNNLLV